MVPVPVFRCPIPHINRIAETLGVADYLVKPISREDLLSAIQRLNPTVGNVLIVDDDTHFVRLLARMLASDPNGYRISTAHNGEEALDRLRREPFDLLLADLAIPGLDGIGVIQQMARDPHLGTCA